jgi:glycyl-tRNA synthetase beta chain
MANFLFEVGTEELPASFIDEAIAQWRQKIPQQLQELQLDYSRLSVFGTPRRLALLIENLPDRQHDRTVDIKGPALTAAYENGEPTRALLGFMRSKGLTEGDLQKRETDKGVFIYGLQTIGGKPTPDILTTTVAEWLTGLEGKRLMRWGENDLKFPRPIRWLVALWADQVLPLELPLSNGANLNVLTSDRFSQGHRVLHPQPVVIGSAEAYGSILANAGVVVDVSEREQLILEQIRAIEKSLSAQVKVPLDLLGEVVNLVEYPTAILGQIDPDFLSLPPEVIETEMIKHQRYFPVYSADGSRLLPHFITISNGDPRKADIIAKGNARVIRARLADGKFFFESDRAHSLESFLPQLAKITFQEQLGSVSDKVERMERILPLAMSAIPNLSLSEGELLAVQRTIALCKADLATQMVKEFPELQGIMGGHYARASGEGELVAEAIASQYLPRPATLIGQLAALCDRLDTLVGIFSLGILPTGSSDPFALRRAATSILQIAWQNHFNLNLCQLLQSVMAIFGKQEQQELYGQLLRWFRQRCDTLLTEQGLDYDLIDALFGQDNRTYTEFALSDLANLQNRARSLQSYRQNGSLAQVYAVVNRASRLADQHQIAPAVLPEYLVSRAEQVLWQSLQELPTTTQNYDDLMTNLLTIAPALTNFFDEVMVMVDDEPLRKNRLSLLSIIGNYSRNLADFSCLRSDL